MPRRSPKASPKKAVNTPSRPQRLQRVLASAGFGSRRQCEELIEAGRVEVDGEVVTKLGTTVDPTTAKVFVDGVPLKKQKLVYFAVNKPVGVVTTNSDPHGRPRVVDLVPKTERVYPVGRLDRSSEGLILLTNDGDLAQRLTHPKFGVRKVYRVTVAGRVDSETMKRMRQGIYIAEGHVRVEGAKIVKSRSKATELEIVLREGKNREIRRILARLGHKVLQLRRIAVGPLRLGVMPPGSYRIVTREEVRKLQQANDPSSDQRGSHGGAGRRSGSKKPGRKATASRRPTKAGTRKPTAKPNRSEPQRAASNEGVVIGADASSEAAPSTTRKSMGVKKSRRGRKPAHGGKGSMRKVNKKRASGGKRANGGKRSSDRQSGRGKKKTVKAAKGTRGGVKKGRRAKPGAKQTRPKKRKR